MFRISAFRFYGIWEAVSYISVSYLCKAEGENFVPTAYRCQTSFLKTTYNSHNNNDTYVSFLFLYVCTNYPRIVFNKSQTPYPWNFLWHPQWLTRSEIWRWEQVHSISISINKWSESTVAVQKVLRKHRTVRFNKHGWSWIRNTRTEVILPRLFAISEFN